MVKRERDEESGQYVNSFSDEQFLEAIREKGGFAGTSEISDIIGCTRRNAYNRLKELEDSNRVKSRNTGRDLIWTLPD